MPENKTAERGTGYQFLSSKLVLVGGLVILALIIFAFGKQILRKVQVDREIAQINAEVTDLEKRNQELNDLLKYFESDSYKEKEARAKLNLQKPGERVVVVPEGDLPNQNTANVITPTADEQAPENGKNNPARWWGYFFATRT